MFEDIFAQFYDKNNDIKVIGVWGKDGLVLERKVFSQFDDSAQNIDLDFSGAELADIISKLDNTKTSSGDFFIKLNFHGYLLLIFSLTGDYFLMILTEQNVIEGKLKFYINLYKDQLLSAL
jgi:hypothetical protein